MIQMQGMLIAAGVGCLLAFGAGTQVGRGWEASASVKALDKAKAAAGKLIDQKDKEIDTLTIERDQRQAQIDKYNAATSEQQIANAAAAELDRIAKQAAADRTEKAAISAARDAAEARRQTAAALEWLKNASDECVKAPVPADLKRVLDDIRASAKTDVRDGSMPGVGGQGRP